MAAALILCAFSAEAVKVKGNGNVITKEIPVSEYDKLDLGGDVSVSKNGPWGGKNADGPIFKYTHGKAATLTITMDENLFEYLKVKSDGGELSIRTRNNTRIRPTRCVIESGSENLESLRVSGSMDFESQNAIEEESLDIKVSGGGDISFPEKVTTRSCRFTISGGGDLDCGQLDCGELACKVSGGGDARLRGKADKADYTISGGGDLNAYGIDVRVLECSVSGGGDARVRASETMKLSASGGGDLYYKGPAKVSKSKSGAGDIHDAN